MAGTLDLTFNNKGWNDLFALGINSVILSIVLDKNTDKYIFTGYTTDNDGLKKLLIGRYTNSGFIDTTFNGTGYITQTFYTDQKSEGRSIVVDRDGKYVVCGNTNDSDGLEKLLIVRYTNSGLLDNTFNSTGYVIGSFGLYTVSQGYSIVVDNDGKYVITGTVNLVEDLEQILIAKYTDSGLLDTTFNNTGYIIESFESFESDTLKGYSIVVDNDGKYIVSGHGGSNVREYIIIARYNNNGSLDKTFNGTGYNSYLVDGVVITMQGIIDNNKYVICIGGLELSQFSSKFTIVRYDNSGILDKTFNGNGAVTQSFFTDIPAYSNSILVDNDGKYVVAGSTYTEPEIAKLVIARYNSSGSLDTSFNNGSNYVIQTFPNTNISIGNSIILDNGNYVIGGVIVLDDAPYGLIARYLSGYIPTPPLPPSNYAIVRFNIYADYNTIFSNITLDYYKTQLIEAIYTYTGAPRNSITILSVTSGSIVNEVQLPSQYVTALQNAFILGLFAIILLEQRYPGIPNSFVIVNNICFHKGTQILTPNGYKSVEHIQNGDLLMTANGKITTVQKVISFIGTEKQCPLYVLPRNSMGRNVPITNLYMSEGHAYRHKGNWCHMKCSSIAKKVKLDNIEYYNIAVDNYITDTLVANGVEVESLFNIKHLNMTWNCKEDDCKPVIKVKNM
jgi:uncharacterized delta-60 repeat protein